MTRSNADKIPIKKVIPRTTGQRLETEMPDFPRFKIEQKD